MPSRVGGGGASFDITGGDHYTTREAKYHSRVKVMDKMDAVEKPTALGEDRAAQHRQVNDPGSLSKAEELGLPWIE